MIAGCTAGPHTRLSARCIDSLVMQKTLLRAARRCKHLPGQIVRLKHSTALQAGNLRLPSPGIH